MYTKIFIDGEIEDIRELLDDIGTDYSVEKLLTGGYRIFVPINYVNEFAEALEIAMFDGDIWDYEIER